MNEVNLAPKKQEILDMILENPNITIQEMSETLGKSTSTLRQQMSEIYAELGVDAYAGHNARIEMLMLMGVL